MSFMRKLIDVLVNGSRTKEASYLSLDAKQSAQRTVVAAHSLKRVLEEAMQRRIERERVNVPTPRRRH